MDTQLSSHIITTLQLEYSVHHQELLAILTSMDVNLGAGLTMIGIAVSLAVARKENRFLFIVPTIIFITSCIHLLKAASANTHGIYCQLIEVRLRAILGDAALLTWEGGSVSATLTSPYGVVNTGFYIIFLTILGIFVWIAIFAYRWKTWTAIIHICELCVIVGYAIVVLQMNTHAFREKILLHNLIAPQQTMCECFHGG